MLEEEKKLEENDIAINSEEDVDKLREQIEDEVINEHAINEAQQKLFEKALEEATMPVEMTNEKFKLGDTELDIRRLDKKNYNQMMFRIGALNIVYQKQILTSLIDLTRLCMVIADKLGVEDIVAATDMVIEKVTNKNKELKDLTKLAKDKQDA